MKDVEYFLKNRKTAKNYIRDINNLWEIAIKKLRELTDGTMSKARKSISSQIPSAYRNPDFNNLPPIDDKVSYGGSTQSGNLPIRIKMKDYNPRISQPIFGIKDLGRDADNLQISGKSPKNLEELEKLRGGINSDRVEYEHEKDFERKYEPTKLIDDNQEFSLLDIQNQTNETGRFEQSQKTDEKKLTIPEDENTTFRCDNNTSEAAIDLMKSRYNDNIGSRRDQNSARDTPYKVMESTPSPVKRLDARIESDLGGNGHSRSLSRKSYQICKNPGTGSKKSTRKYNLSPELVAGDRYPPYTDDDDQDDNDTFKHAKQQAGCNRTSKDVLESDCGTNVNLTYKGQSNTKDKDNQNQITSTAGKREFVITEVDKENSEFGPDTDRIVAATICGVEKIENQQRSSYDYIHQKSSFGVEEYFKHEENYYASHLKLQKNANSKDTSCNQNYHEDIVNDTPGIVVSTQKYNSTEGECLDEISGEYYMHDIGNDSTFKENKMNTMGDEYFYGGCTNYGNSNSKKSSIKKKQCSAIKQNKLLTSDEDVEHDTSQQTIEIMNIKSVVCESESDNRLKIRELYINKKSLKPNYVIQTATMAHIHTHAHMNKRNSEAELSEYLVDADFETWNYRKQNNCGTPNEGNLELDFPNFSKIHHAGNKIAEESMDHSLNKILDNSKVEDSSPVGAKKLPHLSPREKFDNHTGLSKAQQQVLMSTGDPTIDSTDRYNQFHYRLVIDNLKKDLEIAQLRQASLENIIMQHQNERAPELKAENDKLKKELADKNYDLDDLEKVCIELRAEAKNLENEIFDLKSIKMEDLSLNTGPGNVSFGDFENNFLLLCKEKVMIEDDVLQLKDELEKLIEEREEMLQENE